MAECSYCNGEMLTVTGCTHRRYTIEGNEYPAVLAEPHGQQCHDCGVMNDEPHHPGCDMEVCPHCGGQLFVCDHGKEAFESMEEINE